MKKTLAALAGIVIGAIAGYGAVLFGWIGYAELAGVTDRDGGKIMGIAFFFAPVAALFCAVIGGIWCARRAGRA